jgi:hypothetical protein
VDNFLFDDLFERLWQRLPHWQILGISALMKSLFVEECGDFFFQFFTGRYRVGEAVTAELTAMVLTPARRTASMLFSFMRR